MPATLKNILSKYEDLKRSFSQDPLSDDVADIHEELFKLSYSFLNSLSRKSLISKIDGKEYFSFENSSGKLSRPVNSSLFYDNMSLINPFWGALKANGLSAMLADDITKSCYTIAISFCCAIDLLKTNDQKTPGTYFEYLMGYLYSRQFKIAPSKQLEVLNLDMKSKLPTDFIFDLGDNMPKYHVPVKTSTRERVVQVWAHQRVLDGVYGVGRFIGVLSCLSETKLDHAKLEVIEICLPDQWRIYQLFIAQLRRIYYLDVPVRYDALNNIFPKIHVKQFGEFFHEFTSLTD